MTGEAVPLVLGWLPVSESFLNRIALRLPRLAVAYRSGRRRLRLVPTQARRALLPSAVWARQLPIPLPMLKAVWWLRTGERGVTVPIDRMLLGGENGLSGVDYAELTDQPLRTSTPIGKSHYVSLLEKARQEGDLGDWFNQSDYLANARLCIRESGHYFGAIDDEGVRQRAKSFVWPELAADQAVASTSPPAQPVRLRPIQRSDYFEIVDGHHRLANAWVEGRQEMEVDIQRGSSWTKLQRLLNGMSWIDGSAELYQPVDAPEVSSWSLVRTCSDRLEKMQRFLDEEGIGAVGGRYLDVGSCYGWFVHQMNLRGWDARGIELDPEAPRLGQIVYGLDPAAIEVGDCALALASERPAGVVSCFSVIHHFVLGKGSCTGEELLRRLDSVTGTVLFLDTGQSNEQWFAETLAAWDPDFIERWILDTSSFRRIVRLGVDEDSVPPYGDNYGRMLFACLR